LETIHFFSIQLQVMRSSAVNYKNFDCRRQLSIRPNNIRRRIVEHSRELQVGTGPYVKIRIHEQFDTRRSIDTLPRLVNKIKVVVPILS